MRKSCIAYRERSRIAVLHEDLLEICDGNMLAAMILSILIYWTDVKLASHAQDCEQAKASGEPVPVANLWIWKSHEGFQHDLMNDKDGMRKVHRTTIATALKVLQDKQFIASRRNPHNNIDQTRQYRIDTEAIQAAIRALPSLTDCLKTDAPLSEIVQSNVGNQSMDCTISDNALPKNRQAIPMITISNYSHEITNKDEMTNAQAASAFAPHTAPGDIHETSFFCDDHLASAGTAENAVALTARTSRAELATGDHTGRLTAQTPTFVSSSLADAVPPVVVPVSNAVPASRTRTRKPKLVSEVNAEEQARITAVFDTFDAVARDCYHDADFSYDRSKAAREAIVAFLALTPRPTVEKLKTHYTDLFKRPKSKDGFLWRDNMSIAAVCREYGRKPKASAVAVHAPTGYTIDEARNARNRARMAEEAAAIRAKREEQQHALSR
jgi:hypothetical protein